MAEAFNANPSLEALLKLKKNELIACATNFHIIAVKPALKKQEIVNIMIDYFVDQGVFEPTALEYKVEKGDFKLQELELRLKFELEAKRMELEAEANAKKAEAEAKKAEAEAEANAKAKIETKRLKKRKRKRNPVPKP